MRAAVLALVLARAAATTPPRLFDLQLCGDRVDGGALTAVDAAEDCGRGLVVRVPETAPIPSGTACEASAIPCLPLDSPIGHWFRPRLRSVRHSVGAQSLQPANVTVGLFLRLPDPRTRPEDAADPCGGFAASHPLDSAVELARTTVRNLEAGSTVDVLFPASAFVAWWEWTARRVERDSVPFGEGRKAHRRWFHSAGSEFARGRTIATPPRDACVFAYADFEQSVPEPESWGPELWNVVWAPLRVVDVADLAFRNSSRAIVSTRPSYAAEELRTVLPEVQERVNVWRSSAENRPALLFDLDILNRGLVLPRPFRLELWASARQRPPGFAELDLSVPSPPSAATDAGSLLPPTLWETNCPPFEDLDEASLPAVLDPTPFDPRTVGEAVTGLTREFRSVRLQALDSATRFPTWTGRATDGNASEPLSLRLAVSFADLQRALTSLVARDANGVALVPEVCFSAFLDADHALGEARDGADNVWNVSLPLPLLEESLVAATPVPPVPFPIEIVLYSIVGCGFGLILLRLLAKAVYRCYVGWYLKTVVVPEEVVEARLRRFFKRAVEREEAEQREREAEAKRQLARDAIALSATQLRDIANREVARQLFG